MLNSILTGVMTAIGIFIAAFLAQGFFKEGAKDRSKLPNKWGKLFGWLVVSVIFAFIYTSFLGTHLENCDDDPIYGRCDRTEDRLVSGSEQTKEFTTAFVVMFVPYAYGLLHNKKN